MHKAMSGTQPEDLLSLDLETLLRNRNWNPKQRILNDEEKKRLKRAVEDFRLFARESPRIRHEFLLPDLPEMRKAQAYTEYNREHAPTPPPGVRISIAERSEKPGINRLYYFYPDDYPEVYRWLKIEEERAFEAFVRAYMIINGTETPRESPSDREKTP